MVSGCGLVGYVFFHISKDFTKKSVPMHPLASDPKVTGKTDDGWFSLRFAEGPTRLDLPFPVTLVPVEEIHSDTALDKLVFKYKQGYDGPRSKESDHTEIDYIFLESVWYTPMALEESEDNEGICRIALEQEGATNIVKLRLNIPSKVAAFRAVNSDNRSFIIACLDHKSGYALFYAYGVDIEKKLNELSTRPSSIRLVASI